MILHLLTLLGATCCSWPVVGLAGKFEPARLILGWLAIRKARQDDVPAVMDRLAKWQSPPRAKRK
jgi:hypothetical protein